MEEVKNKFGLSRKTNIAIASLGAVSASQNSLHAVIAVVVIALVGIGIQGYIDIKKNKKG